MEKKRQTCRSGVITMKNKEQSFLHNVYFIM